VEGKFLDLAQKDGIHLSESHTVARHILGIWHIGQVPVLSTSAATSSSGLRT